MVGYRLLDYEGAMTPGPRTFALRAAFALGAMLLHRPALAQVHWDASAQVGVMKRFLAEKAGKDAGVGPVGQLMGHVALLPLVHVGGYVGHDISPVSGDGATRDITFGGVRVKGMIPGMSTPFHAWIFAGFGYAGVYSRSFTTTFSIPNGDTERHPVRVEGAGGGFFEVPFGLGASYKLYGPWELCAELGGRLGFGFSGSVYGGHGPQVTVLPDTQAGQNATPAGLDRFALGLTVGVLVDL